MGVLKGDILSPNNITSGNNMRDDGRVKEIALIGANTCGTIDIL